MSQDTELNISHEGNLRVLCRLSVVPNFLEKNPEI